MPDAIILRIKIKTNFKNNFLLLLNTGIYHTVLEYVYLNLNGGVGSFYRRSLSVKYAVQCCCYN